MLRKSLLSFVFTLIAFFVVTIATYSWAYYGALNVEAMGIASELLFGSLPSLLWFIVRYGVLLFLVFTFVNAVKAGRAIIALLTVVVAFVLWTIYGFGWFALPDKGLGMLGLLIVLSFIVTVVNVLILAPRAPRMERHTHEERAPRPSALSRLKAKVARWAQDDNSATAQPAPRHTTQPTASPAVPPARQPHD